MHKLLGNHLQNKIFPKVNQENEQKILKIGPKLASFVP